MASVDDGDWINVCVGHLPVEQVANIAREVRDRWAYFNNWYPNGDRKQRAQLKVTRDRFGQYHIYINRYGLKLLLLFAKDVPGPVEQATIESCPPEVPEFLRWRSASSGSTPE